MRAWLGILHDRHPEVVWVPVEPSEEAGSAAVIEVDFGGRAEAARAA